MIALVVAAALAGTPPPAGSPAWAEQADVVEHLGSHVPLDLSFTDASGARVALRSLFDGVHPVVLVLAYYECPQLCSLVLDGAARAMRELAGNGWQLGDQYRAVTISFDATERTDQAARKQAAVLSALGRAGATRADSAAWPFLVGDAPAVTALTGALGFRFLRDPRTGALAHPALIFVLAPDGTISRYLYGTEFRPRDLKLALLEASDGKTGSFGDKILLRCFHYDPSLRRYGPFIARFMKVGGALIFALALATFAGFARMGRRLRTRDEEHVP